MASDPDVTGTPAQPDGEQVLRLLSAGEMEVIGRLADASNATMLARSTLDGVSLRCVYKPVAGERPLWDFPGRTLARREVAAYVLSQGGCWGVVPPTVMREGPFGPGSVQAWVGEVTGDAYGDLAASDPGAGLVDVVAPEDVPAGWLTVIHAQGMDGRPLALVHADEPVLRAMAVFDILANNADRKGGHVLRDVAGRVLGVDHGLTFNVDPKLRTVLWGWAGRGLGPELAADLERVAADLAGETALRGSLVHLLTREEVDATARRARELRRAGRFPRPTFGRPSIPWPAF